MDGDGSEPLRCLFGEEEPGQWLLGPRPGGDFLSHLRPSASIRGLNPHGERSHLTSLQEIRGALRGSLWRGVSQTFGHARLDWFEGLVFGDGDGR